MHKAGMALLLVRSEGPICPKNRWLCDQAGDDGRDRIMLPRRPLESVTFIFCDLVYLCKCAEIFEC
jgi:hypothetical protein